MQDEILKTVVSNIKKYRIKKGLTQEKLSELCGISQDYLSEIERGKKTPSFKRFLFIAAKLNVPPQKFFE